MSFHSHDPILEPDNISGMIGEYDGISDHIDYKSEYDDAKTFLQKVSPYTGENLYDHLSDVLNKILAERPENVIDFFEEYSRKIKEQRFKPLTDHLKDIYVAPRRYNYTMKIMPYLIAPKHNELEPSTADPDDEDVVDPAKRDLIQFAFYYEKAGINFTKQELYCLELSMRKLAKQEKLNDIRFWGKIYGLYKNYIVVECLLSEDEMEKKVTAFEEEENLEKLEKNMAEQEDNLEAALKEVEERQNEAGEGGEPIVKSKIPRPKPPLPVSLYKPPVEAPREGPGEGVNRKYFYVCNEVGDEWTLLPDVTPQQIVVARQIVKYFTGNLDTEIISYPKFPGTEINYLRAQIARISAGTQISPLNYFTFRGGGGDGEEEEEEEEEEEMDEEGGGGGRKQNYRINKRYEPHPMSDMTDHTMAFWVHHTLYILPQGRTKWWDPNPKGGFGEEEVEEEEEEEMSRPGAFERVEPETGPGLLTPCSEDASLESTAPWSVRTTSALFPEHAIAIARSNLWPGAYAITAGKWFENIYIGTGHKHYAHNFSPLPLPNIQEEYPLGPEIMEASDPTAQQEEDWRIAHEPKPKPEKDGEEEEEQEEEEEEDEEED